MRAKSQRSAHEQTLVNPRHDALPMRRRATYTDILDAFPEGGGWILFNGAEHTDNLPVDDRVRTKLYIAQDCDHRPAHMTIDVRVAQNRDCRVSDGAARHPCIAEHRYDCIGHVT